MDALGARSPVRLSAVAEWLIAALFLCATVTVAALIVRELRVAPPVMTAAGVRPPVLATVPAAVPAGSVAVSVLPLAEGVELALGQTVSAVAARLGRSAESGQQEVDRGLVGERLTRFYEYKGRRFILVFEPFERNGEARLAAIYLRQ